MAELAAEGVEKAFGATQALAGVSLAVEAGEVVALVGPNGAGKTTLIRCLTGSISPDTGTVAIRGEPPRRFDRNRFGFLPQSFQPTDRLTPRELLRYYAGLYEHAESVETILSAVGVADVAGTAYRKLSGGQQRRTLLGIAIINDPDILLLDEPTTGIDPGGRQTLWGLIDELVSEGTSVLLTTHSMTEVDRLADRVGILVDGELVAADTPTELVSEYGGSPRLEVTAPSSIPTLSKPVNETADGIIIESVPAHSVGDILSTLVDQGIEFEAVTWRDPSLETVYLDLVNEATAEDPGRLNQ